ncbi:unnamed protein product [Phytomonas sp. Hart1]|nr:unnamed protein product [Phytomonas sp. Hart1]|eukprot:CCW68043.1 unnamed protein product [Phytomonas sp. isolate Hart1]
MKSCTIYFLCVFLLFTLFTQEALGWNCKGHMAVAEIARRHLSEENQQKVNKIALSFSESGPFLESVDFVQAACWPDDLKSWHMFAMKSWHYIDLPYSPDNTSVNNCDVQHMNVISAIQSMIAALRVKKSPAYVLNFALVNLVHFIGDIHQPLHTTTRYAKNHPHGDAGGNTFFIFSDGLKLSLHKLWDDICIPHYKPLKRPLSNKDYADLKVYVDYLEHIYTFDSALLEEVNIETFAMESHAFGINTTYVGINEGEELSGKYLVSCQIVAEARLTLAGYRLANILNTLLDNIDLSQYSKKKYHKPGTNLIINEKKHQKSIKKPESNKRKVKNWNFGKFFFPQILQ